MNRLLLPNFRLTAYRATDKTFVCERELAFLVRLDARISEGAGFVDKENETVLIHFYTIDIIIIAVDKTDTALLRVIFDSQSVRIGRMNGLISNRIIIQAFHDVDLATIRPTLIFRQQPECWPCASCPIQLGTDIQTPVGKTDLALRINAPVIKGAVSAGKL